MLPEAGLVYLNEPHLPDRGGGLQLVHGARAARPAQALDALGDGAARDQDELPAGLTQFGNLFRPARDRRCIQPGALVGDERAPDLDDETPCLFHGAFADSKNFITAKLSSRHPSPLSAE